MLEKTIENDVCAYAKKKYGVKQVHIRKMNGTGYRNWPDRAFWIEHSTFFGVIFMIEFKQPGKYPSPGQWEMIKRLRACGTKVYIVDSTSDGKLIVDYEMGVVDYSAEYVNEILSKTTRSE